jgi:formylglycine-generating enzyme required for sulfatase activity
MRLAYAVPVALLFAAALLIAADAPKATVYDVWPFDSKEAAKRQDETAKALGKPKSIAVKLGGAVAIKFVLIPAGKYKDDAGKDVIIDKSFYIGQYKVTQEQYACVMGKDPSTHAGTANPADSVTWADATAFCAKVSKKSKKTVRLLSEAEWEYACRAGTATRCYWGDDMTHMGDYCWYHDNCLGKTHPVGEKKPNAFGLYDMMGLLWEWCADIGPDAAQHVCRGATWGSREPMIKSSVRSSVSDDKVNDRFGFRVAMDVEREESRSSE